jgi:hypothetical protein
MMKLKINILLILLVLFLTFIIYQIANNLNQSERNREQIVHTLN